MLCWHFFEGERDVLTRLSARERVMLTGVMGRETLTWLMLCWLSLAVWVTQKYRQGLEWHSVRNIAKVRSETRSELSPGLRVTTCQKYRQGWEWGAGRSITIGKRLTLWQVCCYKKGVTEPGGWRNRTGQPRGFTTAFLSFFLFCFLFFLLPFPAACHTPIYVLFSSSTRPLSGTTDCQAARPQT